MKDESAEPGDILIVDDTPENLQVLSSLLKDAGHRVRPVPSGELALRAAAYQMPDLILLDINMPGMSGFEVCRRLKADPMLAQVPVLFISALSEHEERMAAFSLGCVDFVSKPFEVDEVRVRVETHLRLRRLHLEVEAQNGTLREARERLLELQGLRDGLVHMIVHDMRSPLTGIVNSLRFLREDSHKLLGETSQKDLEQAIRSSRRLIGMINDLLDVNRMESQQMPVAKSACQVSLLVDAAVDLLGPTALRVRVDLRGEEHFVDCDEMLMQRVVLNLLDNAAKFCRDQSPIVVSAERRENEIVFSVTDSGPGIPPEFQQKIFDKFGQVEARSKHGMPSTGLGLAFCKLAVEVHGGSIGVTSTLGEGSTFWFSLPLAQTAPSSGEPEPA